MSYYAQPGLLGRRRNTAIGTHRYWRVYMTASRGDANLTIIDLELRTAVGGPDQTSPAEAATKYRESGHSGSFVGSQAFDDNPSTLWAVTATQGWPAWIGWDFGAGNAKDIVEIVLHARPSDEEDANPANVRLDWSDDGVTWTTRYDWGTMVPFANSEPRALKVDVPHSPDVAPAYRFWRVYMAGAQADTTYVSIAELELRGTSGGPDLTSPALAPTYAFASSFLATSGGWPPSDAFGATVGTGEWLAALPGPEWLAWDFGEANEKQIAQIMVQMRGHPEQDQGPSTLKLQASRDKATWVDIYDWGTMPRWAAAEQRVLTVGQSAAPNVAPAHRYWRLYSTANQGDPSYVAVDEIELRLASGAADQTSAALAPARVWANSFLDSGWLPEYAFTETSSSWLKLKTAGGSVHWIAYDFGFGNEKNINAVTLKARPSPEQDQMFGNFSLQWSDDGTNWTTKHTFSGYAAFGAGENREFVVP